MIELRLLSLFVERSQAGRLGCGWRVSEGVIIDDNRLVYADFGAIRAKMSLCGQFQGGENATIGPFSAQLRAKLGLPISLFPRACARTRVTYIYRSRWEGEIEKCAVFGAYFPSE